jgi:hypothetical protein
MQIAEEEKQSMPFTPAFLNLGSDAERAQREKSQSHTVGKRYRILRYFLYCKVLHQLGYRYLQLNFVGVQSGIN